MNRLYACAVAAFGAFAIVVAPASGARVTGVDVSEYQGTMNWTTAYNKGISFAFVRADRGGTASGAWSDWSYNDIKFSTNVTNLRSTANAGKVIYNGFYHYARPDVLAINDGNNAGNNINDANHFNSQPAQSTIIGNANDEAAHFWSTIDQDMSKTGVDASRRLRPVLDLEEWGGPSGSDPGADQLTKANLSLWARTFLNTFQSLSSGIRPMIYMGQSAATTNIDSTLASETYWMAKWDYSTTSTPTSGMFNSWSFHQYDADGNGQGSAYGATSLDIDRDVANGDINFLKTYLIPEPVTAPILAGIALLMARRRRV